MIVIVFIIVPYISLTDFTVFAIVAYQIGFIV